MAELRALNATDELNSDSQALASPPTDPARRRSNGIVTSQGRQTLRPEPTVLPHEIIFGGFLLVTWVRLAARLGWLNWFPLIFLGCLLGAVGMVAWYHQQPGAGRCRLRLLYYPVAMGLTFFTLRDAVPAVGTSLIDHQLL